MVAALTINCKMRYSELIWEFVVENYLKMEEWSKVFAIGLEKAVWMGQTFKRQVPVGFANLLDREGEEEKRLGEMWALNLISWKGFHFPFCGKQNSIFSMLRCPWDTWITQTWNIEKSELEIEFWKPAELWSLNSQKKMRQTGGKVQCDGAHPWLCIGTIWWNFKELREPGSLHKNQSF